MELISDAMRREEADREKMQLDIARAAHMDKPDAFKGLRNLLEDCAGFEPPPPDVKANRATAVKRLLALGASPK